MRLLRLFIPQFSHRRAPGASDVPCVAANLCAHGDCTSTAANTCRDFVVIYQLNAQVLHENKLLEQEISSVKELSVSVARWLVQGSAVEIRPLGRQGHTNNEVRTDGRVPPCSSGGSFAVLLLQSEAERDMQWISAVRA